MTDKRPGQSSPEREGRESVAQVQAASQDDRVCPCGTRGCKGECAPNLRD